MICIETATGSEGCGLGNQLFRYAFARAVQLATGEKITFYDYHRRYDVLHARCVLPQIVPQSSDIEFIDCPNQQIGDYFKEFLPVRYYFYLILQKMWRIFHKKLGAMTEEDYLELRTALAPIMNRLGIYLDAKLARVPYKRYSYPKRFYLFGYFFSRDYFKEYEEVIRKELLRPDLISEKNQALLSQIHATNSVCLHMRYGDFLNERFINDLYVCGEEYYQEGVRLACRDLKDPVFYVFTDEIERVEKFLFPEGVNYVIVGDGNSALEDLQLMAQCKHFIIPNSTLSWWGQFLGTYEHKRVYGPTRWFRPSKERESGGLIEENWIKIHAALPKI